MGVCVSRTAASSTDDEQLYIDLVEQEEVDGEIPTAAAADPWDSVSELPDDIRCRLVQLKEHDGARLVNLLVPHHDVARSDTSQVFQDLIKRLDSVS